MFEPAQQKKDSPTDGEPSSRYSAVEIQHEYSNTQISINYNCIHSFDTISYIIELFLIQSNSILLRII